ncbi:serine hydrolase domain-containing protein [Gryllotalpicola reticulitermitis]|uniref:Serine hydrolase domain-containing protein n=1 Tax=Gryllotalpicola reticulitermitis TaxID=1184153 RepID=A0ABV8Q7E9_9MICO
MAMERTSPSSVGIDPAAIAKFVEDLDAGHHGVHGLVIARHGRVAAEGWWHPYSPDEPHMMFSVSKAFTSMAVGLAIDEGLLGLDEPTHAVFPEHREVPGQTIRHLLTMTSGHPEDLWSTLQALPERDWVELFFESPAPYEPGTHFVYSTASSYVLAAAVTRRAGVSVTEYLTSRLFGPLGWATPHWERDARGIEFGGTGLKLTTRQLAQFGQLLLQRGEWEGRQLVPAAWIDQASAHQTRNIWFDSHESAIGYGFQLWRSSHGFRADGMCGQFAVVIPELELVVATTSGSSDANRILETIWRRLLPGVEEGHAAPAAADGDALELTGLSVPDPDLIAADASAEAALGGRAYRLPRNALGIEQLTVTFTDDAAEVELAGPGEATSRFTAGRTQWIPGTTPLTPLETLKDVPHGAWAGWVDGTLEIHRQLVGTPFRWVWRITPDTPEGPLLSGHFRPDLGLPSRIDMILTAGQ